MGGTRFWPRYVTDPIAVVIVERQEREMREKTEREKAVRETAEREKAGREKIESEKTAREKSEREEAERETTEREQAEREKECEEQEVAEPGMLAVAGFLDAVAVMRVQAKRAWADECDEGKQSENGTASEEEAEGKADELSS